MVRLYVGGLPADIKQPELTARFTPFGQVAGCEVVPAKGLDATPGCCRGFAYVDLTPKDEQALSRCLSLYNGCKWRGHVLRVEVAKAHYALKLQQEQADEQQQEQLASELQQLLADAQLPPASGAVRLKTPRGKTVVVRLGEKPKDVKNWFPSNKSKPLEQLSWEPLPVTSSALYRQEQLEAAAQQWRQQQADRPHGHIVVTAKQPVKSANGKLKQPSHDSHAHNQQAPPPQLLQQQAAATASAAAKASATKVPPPNKAEAAASAHKLVPEAFRQLKLLKRMRDSEDGPLQPQPATRPGAPAPRNAQQASALAARKGPTAQTEVLGVVDFADAAEEPAAEGSIDLDRFGGASSSDEDGDHMPAPKSAKMTVPTQPVAAKQGQQSQGVGQQGARAEGPKLSEPGNNGAPVPAAAKRASEPLHAASSAAKLHKQGMAVPSSDGQRQQQQQQQKQIAKQPVQQQQPVQQAEQKAGSTSAVAHGSTSSSEETGTDVEGASDIDQADGDGHEPEFGASPARKAVADGAAQHQDRSQQRAAAAKPAGVQAAAAQTLPAAAVAAKQPLVPARPASKLQHSAGHVDAAATLAAERERVLAQMGSDSSESLHDAADSQSDDDIQQPGHAAGHKQQQQKQQQQQQQQSMSRQVLAPQRQAPTHGRTVPSWPAAATTTGGSEDIQLHVHAAMTTDATKQGNHTTAAWEGAVPAAAQRKMQQLDHMQPQPAGPAQPAVPSSRPANLQHHAQPLVQHTFNFQLGPPPTPSAAQQPSSLQADPSAWPPTAQATAGPSTTAATAAMPQARKAVPASSTPPTVPTSAPAAAAAPPAADTQAPFAAAIDPWSLASMFMRQGSEADVQAEWQKRREALASQMRSMKRSAAPSASAVGGGRGAKQRRL